jgi:hypothetical protein
MNGEELYQVYVDANDYFDIGVSSWHELDPLDQHCWNKMAKLLEEGRGVIEC